MIFRNRPTRHKNCLWQSFFVNWSGRNEQSLEGTFYRCFLPSFSSFGQVVSEEKIQMWKVNRRQTSSDGKSSLGLWPGELKKTPPKPDENKKRRGNKKWTIQRHWHHCHWAHKTQDKDKQNNVTPQKTKNMSNVDPTKTFMNLGVHEVKG